MLLYFVYLLCFIKMVYAAIGQGRSGIMLSKIPGTIFICLLIIGLSFIHITFVLQLDFILSISFFARFVKSVIMRNNSVHSAIIKHFKHYISKL